MKEGVSTNPPFLISGQFTYGKNGILSLTALTTFEFNLSKQFHELFCVNLYGALARVLYYILFD